MVRRICLTSTFTERIYPKLIEDRFIYRYPVRFRFVVVGGDRQRRANSHHLLKLVLPHHVVPICFNLASGFDCLFQAFFKAVLHTRQTFDVLFEFIRRWHRESCDGRGCIMLKLWALGHADINLSIIDIGYSNRFEILCQHTTPKWCVVGYNM